MSAGQLYEERKCPKHKPGHCWHGIGTTSFKGMYQEIQPVQCCHCGAKAKQTRHANDGISDVKCE